VFFRGVWCFAAFGHPVFAADEDWRIQVLNERYDDFSPTVSKIVNITNEESPVFPSVKENARWDRQQAIAAKEFIKNARHRRI